ncbi:MAG: protein kinase [Myxococcales bacterium]|nr:protein kinase [Myxococcales bacterium]
MSTSAQSFVCPRCQTAFAEPSQYCRQCGSDMSRATTQEPVLGAAPAVSPAPNASLDATAQVEAISPADRRLTDSNQAWLGKLVDGRYRVIEVIGRGGMGVVYRVEHLRMGKIAAMKVLHRDLVGDPEVQRRFETEAASISKLNHPHTVQVFDFGNFLNSAYLIMELVRGLDLGRVISRDGPMPWARAAPLFVQICGALQEAHELGIVHRDLKPENVLITRTTGGRDFAKVLDFGLAKLDGRNPHETDRHSIVGTPYFMAPEQIRGDEVDARTDVYSFGAMMFEVLTGEHLYPSSTAVGALTKHLTGEPDAPSMRNPRMGIPPLVDHICRKALAREPGQRWQSAAELGTALEEAYAETVTEATGPRSTLSRALRGVRPATEDSDESDLRLRRSDIDYYERGLKRRRNLVVALTTLLFAGAAGGVVWFITRKPPPATSEREPNNDPADATVIAASVPVPGYLAKRLSPTEGDRDLYLVKWPSGSRRSVTVTVTAPPNIDINLGVTDATGVHQLTTDEGGIGETEVLHRRMFEGSVMVTVAQTIHKDQKFPIENVSDAYTVLVTEDSPQGETEPNSIDADANPLKLTEELRGYLDTRQDVDLLRWTGEDGIYNVVVRADGLPLVWRVADGKPRTPGAASVELHKGDTVRLERGDRTGTGPLPGRDVLWSIVVTK